MSELALTALATNRYHDRNSPSDAIKILRGDYFATQSGIVLVTVLGLCVSACILCPGVGGLNHFTSCDPGLEGVWPARPPATEHV